ncbi:hypothetical protein AB9P05_23840 [Roseivirga sp. BDSF3-8]|uniref:hypothetical protein n=1 Tax=Roseivirga sp. BDSF3-8 TaxID=3241598 RepID=UPI003531A0F5
MRKRPGERRKSGIRGSLVTVGLGMLLIILLGYYLLKKVSLFQQPEQDNTEQAAPATDS